jgi:hypothetical protein
LTEAVLYKKYKKDEISGSVITSNEPIDLFCSKCGALSTFSRIHPHHFGTPLPDRAPRREPAEKVEIIDFACARNKDHVVYFVIKIEENSVFKIGEYPSGADRYFSEFAKYQKELEDFTGELRTAVQLHTHGFGVGSFVYLRRVFEKVVNDVAIRKHGDDPKWSFEKWRSEKIDVRIKELKDDLPDFLSSNPKLYSVLSKGVHEWDDNECLEYFEVVKAGIEEILDDKIRKDESQKRKNIISGKISGIVSKISESSK